MKNKRSAIIFTFLTLAWTAFIFANSLQTAQQSSGVSNGFCSALASLLQPIGITVDPADLSFAVRKLAHFSEFGLLGVLGGCMFARGYGLSAVYALPLGMLIAAADEFIQYFVPGRACMFTDWCIDTSGLAVGIVLISVFLRMLFEKSTPRPRKNLLK